MSRKVLAATFLSIEILCLPLAFSQTAESLWTYKEPGSEDAKKLNTQTELGHQKSAGTADFRSTNARLAIKYDRGLSEARGDLDYQYLEVKGLTAAHRVHSYTGYDQYLGQKIWGFVLNDYEYNETKKIKYSLLTGAGIKYDILRNDFWKLNFGAALLNRSQESANRIRDNDQVVSYRLKFNITSKTLEYGTIAFYQPSIDDSSYSWSTDFGMTINLDSLSYLKLGYLYSFDSEPLDPTVKKWEERSYLRFGLKI